MSSDNGPVVDDGYRDGSKEALDGHTPAGPLRGGKYSIFEGGTRVPFIACWPGHMKPGVSKALVSQVDFVATFAALTEQTFDAKTSPDSENILPALLGESPVGRTQFVEHSDGLALRQGAWKLIPPQPGVKLNKNTETETGNAPDAQLYDLHADLGEMKNVAAEHVPTRCGNSTHCSPQSAPKPATRQTSPPARNQKRNSCRRGERRLTFCGSRHL